MSSGLFIIIDKLKSRSDKVWTEGLLRGLLLTTPLKDHCQDLPKSPSVSLFLKNMMNVRRDRAEERRAYYQSVLKHIEERQRSVLLALTVKAPQG